MIGAAREETWTVVWATGQMLVKRYQTQIGMQKPWSTNKAVAGAELNVGGLLRQFHVGLVSAIPR